MSEIRLIDANALKEEMQSWLALPNRDNDARDVVLHLIAVIDNAPTVEPEITNDDIKIAIKQGYNDGYEMARAKFERPKGEWIARIDETHYCSNCRGDAIDGDFDEILTDFCPHCGVQMVGGAE